MAFVPLGRVVKTHGVTGEVSVMATGDLPLSCLEGAHVWFVPPPAGRREATIVGVRQGPKGPLVRFAEVTDPNTAAMLRGCTIVIRPGDLPEGFDEPADDDPLGLRVIDAARGDIGEVTDLIVTGANDVWVVTGGPFGEVLVPVIESVVVEVDWDAMVARVELLPGLIEGE